jgi:hypothetical protein
MHDRIEQFVVDAYHNAQDRLLNGSTGSRLRTLHVSDFVSPCLKKVWYQKNFPKPMEQKTKSILYHGLVIHEHTQLSHFHEVTFCYDIEKDKGYTPQEVVEMPRDETKNIITGTLDDLLKVGDDYVIADKKTWNGRGYKKKAPDENYVRQLSIYRVLLQKSYGIDAKYGCLLYLDKGNDLEELPMAFELHDTDITKQFLKDTLKQLQGVPDPTICFLCNGKNKTGKIYCPYAEECHAEMKKSNNIVENTQGLIDKRLLHDL